MTGWREQGLKYGIVGIVSNVVLYLVYLLLTSQGMEPKLAMTVLYAAGVVQTFAFNRSWAFRHRGHAGGALAKYATAYALGYLLNLAVLAVAVDRWELPHQWVQGGMIVLLAALLFLLQRHWVFAAAADARTSAADRTAAR